MGLAFFNRPPRVADPLLSPPLRNSVLTAQEKFFSGKKNWVLIRAALGRRKRAAVDACRSAGVGLDTALLLSCSRSVTQTVSLQVTAEEAEARTSTLLWPRIAEAVGEMG